MKRFLGLGISILLAGNIAISSVANAKTSNEGKERVQAQLEVSEINKYSNVKQVQDKIQKIKNDAIDVTSSDVYVRFSENENETPKTFTESQYNEEVKKEARTIPSDSGNRYSWIKLSLEAYNFGNNDYMFCGFWEWQTKPFFVNRDIVTLGHDSNALFDTESAFAVSVADYWLPGAPESTQSAKVIENNDDKKNTMSDVNGVGFKFNLQQTGDTTPTKYSGSVYCNGRITNSAGANIQISYGHSQFAVDFSIGDVVKFLSNGSISFDIVGTQDLATHGDAVYR